MEHKVPRLETTIMTVVPPITGLIAVSPPTDSISTSPTTGPTAASPTTDPIDVSPTTGPNAVSATPALGPTIAVGVPTPADSIEVEPGGYVPPKKDRTKMVAGGVAILVLIAAGVFFQSQRTANQSFNVAVPPPNSAVLVADSAASVQPPPAGVPESAAVTGVATPAAATIDSQRIADSVKKARAELAKRAAARKDSLKADSAKRAAAKSDSTRRAQDPLRIRARAAATGLMANPGARKTFTQGATHKGGLLGSRSKGDLQTQIDALQPFLKGSGLTYEQFKDAVKASGIPLFDEFGRMVPDELQRFASVGR
jgi:hypothetical protein